MLPMFSERGIRWRIEEFVMVVAPLRLSILYRSTLISLSSGCGQKLSVRFASLVPLCPERVDSARPFLSRLAWPYSRSPFASSLASARQSHGVWSQCNLAMSSMKSSVDVVGSANVNTAADKPKYWLVRNGVFVSHESDSKALLRSAQRGML